MGTLASVLYVHTTWGTISGNEISEVRFMFFGDPFKNH